MSNTSQCERNSQTFITSAIGFILVTRTQLFTQLSLIIKLIFALNGELLSNNFGVMK